MIASRTFSARRYRVVGRLPTLRSAAFRRRLTDRRFLPLGAGETQASGWVRAENLLVTDFDGAELVDADHALFALRVDRRRVNARLLRAQLDLEVAGRRKAARDAGRRERVSRAERQQLRADLEAALLQETPPSVQVCPVVLDAGRRQLVALALGRPLHEVLVRLFRETFGAELVPLTPKVRAAEILAGSEAAFALDGLGRTDFTAGAAAADRAGAVPLGGRV